MTIILKLIIFSACIAALAAIWGFLSYKNEGSSSGCTGCHGDCTNCHNMSGKEN